jgi:hypothetical protein
MVKRKKSENNKSRNKLCGTGWGLFFEQFFTSQSSAVTIFGRNSGRNLNLRCTTLESVSFFLGGKKCQKIVNIRAMKKDRAAQQRLFSGTILRCLTQPLNAYGYKYFSLTPLVIPSRQ